MKKFEEYISNLSDENKRKFIILVNEIMELQQITPIDEPVSYRFPFDFPDSESDKKALMLEKLADLKIINMVDIVLRKILYKFTVNNELLHEFIQDLKGYPISQTVTTIDFPNDFVWIDDNIYSLGDKGKITFASKQDNKTKTYFKMMTNAKNWVEIQEMKVATKESEQQIRIKLNQIKEKIKTQDVGGLISIEARNDRSKPGAYRLIPYPNQTE